MNFARSAIILTLFFANLVLPTARGRSVSKNANSGPSGNSANTTTEHSNVEELGMMINVPYAPEDIVWKEYPKPHKLLAVFRFSPEDSSKIVSAAAAVKQPEPAIISSEPWFPDELVAQGGSTGDDSLKGQAYSPDQFVQEPFNSGRLIRIEGTDYFVLELDAK
ncbi:MAG: hypothetical protein JO053_05565 [Acidobacteria bacterium]|nr:hypothetical protein [Acidobacteriota bacterium]